MRAFLKMFSCIIKFFSRLMRVFGCKKTETSDIGKDQNTNNE